MTSKINLKKNKNKEKIEHRWTSEKGKERKKEIFFFFLNNGESAKKKEIKRKKGTKTTHRIEVGTG